MGTSYKAEDVFPEHFVDAWRDGESKLVESHEIQTKSSGIASEGLDLPIEIYSNGDVDVMDIEEDQRVWQASCRSLCTPSTFSCNSSYATPASQLATTPATQFCAPDETIIIFDWDDTLCPSTALEDFYGLSVEGSDPPEGDLATELEELTLEVKCLLEQATQLSSRVVIVTNATDGWVEACCEAWMPQLAETMKNIPIYSARQIWEPRGVATPFGWKENQFERLIGDFYSKPPSQSWKNIVVVGDSPYEHEALRRVVGGASWWQSWYCRSKSVRFALKPTIGDVKAEVHDLRRRLDEFVRHDGSLDVSLAFKDRAQGATHSSGEATGWDARFQSFYSRTVVDRWQMRRRQCVYRTCGGCTALREV